MVGGKRGDDGGRVVLALQTHPSVSSWGGCAVWRECAPGAASAAPQAEETPQEAPPAHVHFPADSLPRQQGPGFILTSLFPLRMGTHPCRHPGAQPTLGTSVHCGKPRASRP